MGIGRSFDVCNSPIRGMVGGWGWLDVEVGTVVVEWLGTVGLAW